MGQTAHQNQNETTIDYIQTMLGQLCVMARSEGCDMLAYLIEMACIEAHDNARGSGGAGARSVDLSALHKQGNDAA